MVLSERNGGLTVPVECIRRGVILTELSGFQDSRQLGYGHPVAWVLGRGGDDCDLIDLGRLAPLIRYSPGSLSAFQRRRVEFVHFL